MSEPGCAHKFVYISAKRSFVFMPKSSARLPTGNTRLVLSWWHGDGSVVESRRWNSIIKSAKTVHVDTRHNMHRCNVSIRFRAQGLWPRLIKRTTGQSPHSSAYLYIFV